MLTPTDVEQKTFSTALRGYDLDEVDDFLDEVVATLKELNEQLEEARAAADGAPAPVTAIPAPAPEPEAEPVTPARPEIDESAVGRALVAAQNAADKLLEEAENEATRIVEDARSEADSWSAERDAKRREAEAEMSALAARVASVRSELAVLASEVSEKLDDMDSVIEDAAVTAGPEEPEVGGDADREEGESSTEWGGSRDRPRHVEDAATGDETGADPDQLDDILNGVANDLQWSAETGDEPEPGEESEDED